MKEGIKVKDIFIYIYIYMCVCVRVCVCVTIHTYIIPISLKMLSRLAENTQALSHGELSNLPPRIITRRTLACHDARLSSIRTLPNKVNHSVLRSSVALESP